MITIKNTQRKIKIDVHQLKTDAQTVLDALNYSDFDLGIWLCSNAAIRQHNKQYRNKDKVTDILSFPFHIELKAGQRIKATSQDDKNLGDLLIAPDYVLHDAPHWGHTFEQRMKVLLVHGICHVLGYDHETEEEYQVMNKEEKKLLKLIL